MHSHAVPVVTRVTSSSYMIPSKVWQVIWKVRTPPKIRCFLGGSSKPVGISLPRQASPLGLVRWSPSCPMFTKLNVNASWDVIMTYGCVGIVARCAEERFVGARKLMIYAPCIVVVEALAILFGCEFACSLGLHIIIVESDSKKEYICFG